MSVKKGLDLATVLGPIIGIGSLVTAIFLEFNELNPDLGSQFLQVSALMIIFGGTIGATMIGFSIEEMLMVPKFLAVAFRAHHFNAPEYIEKIVRLATLARKEGVLALEQELETIEKEDEFLAKGLRMVVDGVDAQAVEDMLTNELDTMEARHKVGAEIFNAFGGFAPTMGIVGTVVGLIAALAKAGGEEGGGEEGSKAIIGAIATAFIATFYGIGSANLIFLPLAGKLKVKSAEEVFSKQITIIAVRALQSGETPRVIHAKLAMFFRRGIVPEFEKKGGG